MAGKGSFEITIDAEGNIAGEVQEVSGPGCERLLDWLNEAGQVVLDRRTPDYYRREQTVDRRQQAGGRR
jgi:hypothetical protein